MSIVLPCGDLRGNVRNQILRYHCWHLDCVTLGNGKFMKSRSAKRHGRAPSIPTIADVAEYSGFSPMTVSRVINGERNVRARTREAVLAAVAKLNYSPNLAARSLAGAEPMRVGLLYSNPSANYLSQFLIGSLEQARHNHVQLEGAKCDTDNDAEAAARDLLASGVHGFILPPPLSESRRIHAVLARARALTVAVSVARPLPGYSVVRIDDFSAALAMTKHILSLGHRRVGFIMGNPRQTATARRFAGYKEALKDAGLPLDRTLVHTGQFTYRSGLKAAEALLGQPAPPTAIFASNDDMAAAAVTVAHRRHLQVPGDITICGFDDTDFARSIWPELTTIRQPIAAMTRAALSLLTERIKRRRAGKADECKDVVVDFTLVRRQSDGPPKSRGGAGA